MEIKLSPSILSADFANLARDIKIATDAGAEYVHVDVMDGHFVPNITIGAPVVKSRRKATDKVLDVHLMISDPLGYAPQFAKAGADLICFHIEACGETGPGPILDAVEACGCQTAIALKPATPADVLEPWMDRLDMVLVMTVEPGFGGQAFMDSQLETIRQVRQIIDQYNPACELEVDGGIAPKTAPLVVEAGAHVLVAGSAVYGKEDIPAAIAALRCQG